ncbi:nucleolar protein 11-like [Homarus americanus]|uniref:Nucleolar protein 11-like n=1 Tax=Homarus americanus TaxID=6706 RepID=A0A8J5N702_HOMAM|nr:nucleolar protein 11-like [Homarus americanus]KAG7173798.1 Nucleolar protein 11-like [Homarus americanus]
MAATLLSTSFLCSDFHPKNLIGVTRDKDEHLLITCKGNVKLYNVVDRREVRSWTTKSWHPFTSAAVRDPVSDNVVAVIKNTNISQWSHAEDDIDKVKRRSFETSIHQLLVSGDIVYIVFTSGQVEELTTALNSRKAPKPGFLTEGESISYVEIIKDAKRIVMVVEKKDGSLKLFHLQLTDSVSMASSSYSLALKDARLTGICALSSSKLITIWSTGELFCFDLRKDNLEKLPGQHLVQEKCINTSKNSKILELSATHVAIFGLDKRDEGGLLVLRDIKFDVVTSSRKLKMYQNPPQAWVSSEGVIVAEGGSLALIPFIVQESNLATVFGSKVSETRGTSSEACHSWLENDSTNQIVPKEAMDTIFCKMSKELSEIVQSLSRGALSESLFVSDVVSHMIEKKKLLLLDEAMDKFSNIPESCLIDVLNLYMLCKDMEFEELCKYPILQMEFEPLEEDTDKIKCPFGSGKAHFINGILNKPFTDVQLLKDLPKISFDNALSLIQYLHYLITTGEAEQIPAEDVRVPSLHQASYWLSLLLDVNYHQLVMTSEVSIHRLLLSCFTQVTNMRKFLEGLVDTEHLFERVIKAKSLSKQSEGYGMYTLERLVIT